MSIYKNNKKITSIYKGGSEIYKVYKGNTLIYKKESETPSGVMPSYISSFIPFYGIDTSTSTIKDYKRDIIYPFLNDATTINFIKNQNNYEINNSNNVNYDGSITVNDKTIFEGIDNVKSIVLAFTPEFYPYTSQNNEAGKIDLFRLEFQINNGADVSSKEIYITYNNTYSSNQFDISGTAIAANNSNNKFKFIIININQEDNFDILFYNENYELVFDGENGLYGDYHQITYDNVSAYLQNGLLLNLNKNNENVNKLNFYFQCYSTEPVDLNKLKEIDNYFNNSVPIPETVLAAKFSIPNPIAKINNTSINLTPDSNGDVYIELPSITDASNFLNSQGLISIKNVPKINNASMSNAFANNTEIKEIDLSIYFNNNIKDYSACFMFDSNLETVNLSNCNSAFNCNLQNMFIYCSNLKNIIYNENTFIRPNNLNEAFRNCTSLVNLDLKWLDLQNLRQCSGVFYGCSNLNSIINFNFSNFYLEDLSNIFNGCVNLETLEMNFNTNGRKSVLYASDMIKNCNKLKVFNLENVLLSDNATMNLTLPPLIETFRIKNIGGAYQSSLIASNTPNLSIDSLQFLIQNAYNRKSNTSISSTYKIYLHQNVYNLLTDDLKSLADEKGFEFVEPNS